MRYVIAVVSQLEETNNVVDWLSERSAVTMPEQEGWDAGSVLVIDCDRYKLSLLPSHLVKPSELKRIRRHLVVHPVYLPERGSTASTTDMQPAPQGKHLNDAPTDRSPLAAEQLLAHHTALCRSLLRMACRIYPIG